VLCVSPSGLRYPLRLPAAAGAIPRKRKPSGCRPLKSVAVVPLQFRTASSKFVPRKKKKRTASSNMETKAESKLTSWTPGNANSVDGFVSV